jgi:hypothetical protein
MHGGCFPLKIEFRNKPKNPLILKINVILKHIFDAQGIVMKVSDFQVHRRKVKRNDEFIELQILLIFPHIGVYFNFNKSFFGVFLQRKKKISIKKN